MAEALGANETFIFSAFWSKTAPPYVAAQKLTI